MSGLLHRLAAQAIGSANVAHAAARLPFSAAPDRVETANPDVSTEPVSLRPAERSRPVPTTASPLLHPADAVVPAPTSDVTMHETRPRSPLGADPLPPTATDDLSKSGSTSTRSGIVAKPMRDAGDMPPDGTPDRAVTVDRELPPPPVARQIFPEPLLPRQAPSPGFRAPHDWNMRAAAVQGEGGHHAAAGEATADVHVTIGRIELTAIQEAPRAKQPAAKRGAQPMTLEDYLTRRRGRST